MVLVAEAADDLEVAVEARNHQELLHDLRGLREGVELTGLEPTGNEEVAGSFGGRLREHRRLDFEKILFAENPAGGLVEIVADAQVSLQRRPAEIVNPISHPGRLIDAGIVLQRKRRRCRAIEEAHLLGDNFDLARGHLGVDGVRSPPLNGPTREDHILGADLAGPFVALGRLFGAEHDLNDALVVAEVDEDHAAVVAPALHPARDDDLATHIGSVHSAARVAAAQAPHHVEFGTRSRHRVPRGSRFNRKVE